jgi:hypothetical protein
MALDRESIVRRDFATHRRGYDPAAVEAHLEALAGEVDALRQRAAEPATLSSQAGEQVRSIVQAAERGAQEIRDAANAEARERVAHITEAAERLRGRIEQMQADVTSLMADLRTDAERLRNDLRALHEGTAELRGPGESVATERPPAAEPEPPTEVAPATGDDAAAAARIVALDMALSGTPRDETARYLAEHYELADRDGLLDEVYSAAAG